MSSNGKFLSKYRTALTREMFEGSHSDEELNYQFCQWKVLKTVIEPLNLSKEEYDKLCADSWQYHLDTEKREQEEKVNQLVSQISDNPELKKLALAKLKATTSKEVAA